MKYKVTATEALSPSLTFGLYIFKLRVLLLGSLLNLREASQFQAKIQR